MPKIHYTCFSELPRRRRSCQVNCCGLVTGLSFMLRTCCGLQGLATGKSLTCYRLATGKLVKWILALRL